MFTLLWLVQLYVLGLQFEMDVTHTSVFTALGLEKLEKDLLNFTILSKVVFEHEHYTCNI